jgi:hypothetical protein
MPSRVSFTSLSNSTNGLTQRIYELIEWYEQNFTRKEDDYIKANLQLIITLAKNVKNSDDIIFIERIIDTFCDIVRKQREMIQTIECQSQTQPVGHVIAQNGFATSYIPTVSGVTNDEQIRAVFSAYMQKEGKSSFTANDYILRVQNLWRSFYSDYQAGELPSELAESVIEEEIKADAPLLNAYNYIEELNCYVSMKMAGSGGDRNFANTRAAFNTFSKALCGDNHEKVKSERKEPITKDFSKYIFNGETFVKRRLVLAVVRQYVEDYRPATFDELKEAFPDYLQGSLGVVKLIDEVSDKYKGIGGAKRYFVNENEIIRLPSGERAIVCTEWGAHDTEKFVGHVMAKFNYNIEKN